VRSSPCGAPLPRGAAWCCVAAAACFALLLAVPASLADGRGRHDATEEQERPERDDERGEEIGGLLGGLAALGLVVAILPHCCSRLVGRRRGEGEPLSRLATVLLRFRSGVRPVHYTMPVVALGLALLHGLTIGEQSPILWLGLSLIAVQVATGVALAIARARATGPLRATHGSVALLAAAVVVLLLGHALVD
jgi:hypothetical protein